MLSAPYPILVFNCQTRSSLMEPDIAGMPILIQGRVYDFERQPLAGT
jgi:hypothetical protein